MTEEEIITRKKQIQTNALKAWADNNFIGALEIATGVGKTRIGVIGSCEFIMRTVMTETSIILVPTNNLVDQWKREIIKWGYQDALKNVKIITIDEARITIQKYRNTLSADTVILDEGHRVIADANSIILDKIGYKRLMILSATLTQEKRDMLETHYPDVPIVFEYDINDAEKDGLLPKNMMLNLVVDMYDDERKHYSKITNVINMHPEHRSFKHNRTASGSYYSVLNKRKALLYTLESKVDAAVNIIVDKGRQHKIILFSEFIESLDMIEAKLKKKGFNSFYKYHSKMKKAEREEALKLFEQDYVKVMLSSKALNQGYDLPELDLAIVLSGNSSSLEDTQRRGRVLRYKEGKKVVFLNMVSKDTIDEYWAKKRADDKKIFNIYSVNEINL